MTERAKQIIHRLQMQAKRLAPLVHLKGANRHEVNS
jgi:hypothetical protein